MNECLKLERRLGATNDRIWALAAGPLRGRKDPILAVSGRPLAAQLRPLVHDGRQLKFSEMTKDCRLR